MRTLGILLMLLGSIGIQRVAVSRSVDIPTDTSEFVTALISGDIASAQEVFSRRGEPLDSLPNIPLSTVGKSIGSYSPDPVGNAAAASGSGMAIVAEMKRLGAIANNRYVWGATGPTSYDCSGIVWRAVKNLGIFNGARFVTANFASASKPFAYEVPYPAIPGDIVLWTTRGHMGVLDTNGQVFAAKSSRTGIGHQELPSNARLFRVGTR